jgi:hypothetical protein
MVACDNKEVSSHLQFWLLLPFIPIMFITLAQGQEVKFHEIKIQLFQEIEFLIMMAILCLFMRLNKSNNIDQEVDTLIMRLKPKQALFDKGCRICIRDS